jgi:hypothetical protein
MKLGSLLIALILNALPAVGLDNAKNFPMGGWLEKYHACFTTLPGAANRDPIIGLHGDHIVRDWLPIGHYKKDIPGRKEQMERLGKLLNESVVIWTGPDPEHMMMNFVTPTQIYSIPHDTKTLKSKTKRNAAGGPVTDYEYDIMVTDAKGEFPPFFPSSTVIEIPEKEGTRLNPYTGFFFSEEGRTKNPDDFYKKAELVRSKGQELRDALREKLLKTVQAYNESYQLHRDSIAFGNAFVKDPKNLRGLDEDYDSFLAAIKGCLDQFPPGEKDDRTLRQQLVTGIVKFEDTFKAQAEQAKAAPRHQR